MSAKDLLILDNQGLTKMMLLGRNSNMSSAFALGGKTYIHVFKNLGVICNDYFLKDSD